jgi:polar amino acid transport system substrate-binding protein
MRYIWPVILICALALFAANSARRPSPNLSDQTPTPANAEKRPLKVVFTEFPPYTYTNDEGVACGYFVNLVAELLNQKDIPHVFASNPTPRIHFQLKSGDADIYLGPQGVPNLQEHIRVISLPERFNIKLSLWRKPATPNTQNLAALKNISLAIINGFGYGGVLQQLDTSTANLRIVRSNSHGNAFKMLLSGRVDYLLDYEKPISEQLALHPTEIILQQPILNIPVAFMVSMHIDDSLELFTTLSASVEQYFKSFPPLDPNNVAVAVDSSKLCKKQE